jgi:hypothetical protein
VKTCRIAGPTRVGARSQGAVVIHSLLSPATRPLSKERFPDLSQQIQAKKVEETAIVGLSRVGWRLPVQPRGIRGILRAETLVSAPAAPL